jgi:predicted peptidase
MSPFEKNISSLWLPAIFFLLTAGIAVSMAPQMPKGMPRGEHRPGGVPGSYQIRTYSDSMGQSIRYGWLAPKTIEGDEKYPVVLCLHGSAGNSMAADVLGKKKMREKYPCFVLVPESVLPAIWASVPGNRRTENAQQKLPLAIEALKAEMEKNPIDPGRVYVTGQSLGGVGSWAAIARYPQLFAAAVPVCGAWRVADVPKMIGVPVWAFHGEKDTTVPVRFSRELTAALIKAGGTAKYTEYPGVAHNSWTKAYADQAMWEWLFSRRKTAP